MILEIRSPAVLDDDGPTLSSPKGHGTLTPSAISQKPVAANMKTGITNTSKANVRAATTAFDLEIGNCLPTGDPPQGGKLSTRGGSTLGGKIVFIFPTLLCPAGGRSQ